MSRRSLLAAAFLFIIISLALVLTGGFATSIMGVRVSARSPGSAIGAAVILALAWLMAAYRAGGVVDDLGRIEIGLQRRAPLVVLAVALCASGLALRFFSVSAGGADASGYLSHAEMWTTARLTRVEVLDPVADWADARATVAPLGWRPAVEAGHQVPTYAAGLPMLLAPLLAAGGAVLASLLIPVSLGLAVWSTGRLAYIAAGPSASIIAAVWMATSPVALVESMQFMSDVPVTAAWLLAWVLLVGERPRILAAAMATAVAILIRPNLAPVALVPLLFLVLGHGPRPPVLAVSTRDYDGAQSSSQGDPRLREIGIDALVWFRGRPAAIFAIPVALAGLIVALLQWRWFGSPLRSGYGTAAEIYAFANVLPNAAQYARWLLETHGPWLFLAPVGAWWPRRGSRVRRWLLIFAATVCSAYLIYAVFDGWTYLRFLLPALALAMIAVAALIAGLVEKMPGAARVVMVLLVVVAGAAANLSAARTLDVFRGQQRQSRVALIGRYLDGALPATAVMISGEQSGAMRYYTARPIVRWDLVTRDGLNPIVSRLTTVGAEVWIVLDEWEEELFRRKFPSTAGATLDWPPVIDAGDQPRTRAWRLRDRAAFHGGVSPSTDRLR
ncbi:MAG TPA: hypothetical protein VNJ02_01455 [Vicinamibacterales bacterium]|nr:hypothetical protein [Vicinamibacterales bacterium]